MSESYKSDQSLANQTALSQEEENKWLKDELAQSNFLIKQLRQQISDLEAENKILGELKVSFFNNRVKNMQTGSPTKSKGRNSATSGHDHKCKINKSDVNKFIKNSFLYPNSPSFKQPNEKQIKKTNNYALNKCTMSRGSISKLDNKSDNMISKKSTISTIYGGKGNSIDNDFSFEYNIWDQYDSLNTPTQSISKTISNSTKKENSSSSALKNDVIKTSTTVSRECVQFRQKRPDGIIKVISVNLSDNCQKNIIYLKNQVKKSLEDSNIDLQNIKLTYCDNERDQIQLEDEDDFYNALQEAEINEMSKLDLFLSTYNTSIENPIMENDIIINDLNSSGMLTQSFNKEAENLSLKTPVFADVTKKHDLNEISLISMTRNSDFNQLSYDEKPHKRISLKRAKTSNEFDKSP